MSNRHLSRALTLQSLFMWDFNEEDASYLDFYIDYNLQKFGLKNCDREFIDYLTKSVVGNRVSLDEMINRYTKEWPVDRLTLVDRNILRMAIFEMFNSAEVPTKVALNEGVELAKEYGGSSSQKFVSGVLGTLYEEHFKNKASSDPLDNTQ
ncbi:MAG: transcription antitermination factor NusB [Candidatus Jacksonbacteria bacterium RIFOXYC2_FULL_44_29]|nr:MAG: N utilization substance protein B-like protein [Parcubacteria group bacterium GW2011_GWA2_42_28]KKT55872.1 MAG: N utilization substance protein B-like protein [Parcubacteria group bacterium GW2011_GWC2_44_22]OGY74489.1 MAG: transcription antitermination factor NusB [Candidatus Jacksonbacteria bacterium RIFOXYA2_FULL_43_12]OGY77398.1 MAG: transcription antitermination factor NusB [Candidatus Jacksonbacteria bacterium RIFOXYB2_FULL_44_15]OGY78224.1 MAG: transcription antitermination facto